MLPKSNSLIQLITDSALNGCWQCQAYNVIQFNGPARVGERAARLPRNKLVAEVTVRRLLHPLLAGYLILSEFY